MKQLLFLLFMGMLHQAGAQTIANPYPRTITVNGSAEMEVIPDEIYVQVDLKEYEKKGNPKKPIDLIKSEFLDHIRKLGIPDSAVSIASYEGYNGYPWWLRKKKNPDMLASISYQVKLNSSYKVDQLVNVLDDEATQNFQVVRTSHSRINEFRKQLKIQAVKAAKDKAMYLTEAINEKAGEAVTINEPSDVSLYYYSPRGYVEMNKVANVRDQSVSAPETQGIDFKKIKLKFDVNVVFAIK
ncbi:MAG TPA: SIMPL domain-containing protein [Chitinophagaceae bacterium]